MTASEWQMVRPEAEIKGPPPPPDFAQCQGEYLSAAMPDRVGPPPAKHRCFRRPTWLLADASPQAFVTGVRYEAFVMSVCDGCRRSVRAGHRRRRWEIPAELHLQGERYNELEAAWRMGGDHALLDLLEAHLKVPTRLYTGWVRQLAVRWYEPVKPW